MPEDVYRQGKVDVHHAFRSGGIEFEHDTCRLDGRGNTWTTERPDGPQCAKCFAGMAEDQAKAHGLAVPARPRLRGQAPAFAAGAAVVALVATVLGGGSSTPASALASPTGASFSPGAPILSPAASLGASALPTFSPGPSEPVPSLVPAPTVGPSVPPAPRPTVRPPAPTPAPSPAPSPCPHPGQHLGADPCGWKGGR